MIKKHISNNFGPNLDQQSLSTMNSIMLFDIDQDEKKILQNPKNIEFQQTFLSQCKPAPSRENYQIIWVNPCDSNENIIYKSTLQLVGYINIKTIKTLERFEMFIKTRVETDNIVVISSNAFS